MIHNIYTSKKRRIAKYIHGFIFSKIKKKNLDFLISYNETGSDESYTEVLNWSEIEKPKAGNIEVQKIIILENDKEIKNLEKSESEKLVRLLDRHNRKPITENR